MIQKVRNIINQKLSFDLKELLKGGGTAFLVNLSGMMLLYILTLIITNKFGAKIYGDYALFVTTIKITAIISIFGVDIMSLRYISEYFSKSQWTKINDMTWQSYLSIFIFSISVALLFYFGRESISEFLKVPTNYVILLGLTVIPFCFYKFHNQCFRSQKKIILFSSFEFALIPFFCIISLGVVTFFDLPVENKMYIPIGVHIGVIVTLSLFTIWLWTRTRIQNTKEKYLVSIEKLRTNFVPNLKKGFPFLMARTSIIFAAWIMLFLLKYFESSSEVGIYEASLKVAQLAILPLSAINAIAGPKFSEFYGKNNKKGLEKTAQQATLISIALSLPVLLLVFLFPHTILSFFGPEFPKGVVTLQILAVSQMLNALTGPVALVLQMTERQTVHQYITFSSMLLSLIAGLFLIPRYGLTGTAMSYLIFVVINNGTCFLWINFKLKIRTLSLKNMR